MFTVYCVDKYTSVARRLYSRETLVQARKEARRSRRVYMHVVIADETGKIHSQYMDKNECLCPLTSVEVA